MSHEVEEAGGLIAHLAHLRHLGHEALTIIGFFEIVREFGTMAIEQLHHLLGG